MSLIIENESGEELLQDGALLAQNALEAVLDTTDCPYEAQVNLLLTGEEQIREMNRLQRGIDQVTDVLSFPALTFETPGVFPKEDDYTDDLFDMDSGELILGDVMLCTQKVRQQARMYGHSLEREYVFLLVHSFLHLCGYDHIEEEDRLLMEEMQKKIMGRIGILRGGRENGNC